MAIVGVVKYNGNPDVFAWKYPGEELGTWTQLIVNESQEAVLYKGGQALDLFTAGRHTLETANIPILNEVINLPFGGRSPFAAEVWFINKAFSLDIKWGTPTPIQIQDPKYKVFIPLRSFGQFGIQIADSRKFLAKLVGTLPLFDKDSVSRYFKGLYLTKVKDSISSYLINNGISALEINACLEELSQYLKEKMTPVFNEYGINLLNFFVNDINVPEEDEAVKRLKGALAKKAEMDIVGYSYVQQRSFDTLEGAATNPGMGNAGLMNAGMGLGMGVGLGGAFGSQVAGIAQNIRTGEMKRCPKCNSEMEVGKRFCSSCGFDTSEKADKIGNKPDSIICDKCGCELPKGSKFCTECGEPLVRKCPECGSVIEGAPKFCPECGKKL